MKELQINGDPIIKGLKRPDTGIKLPGLYRELDAIQKKSERADHLTSAEKIRRLIPPPV
jgi:hypothetical protein